jgi:hypothetical protein
MMYLLVHFHEANGNVPCAPRTRYDQHLSPGEEWHPSSEYGTGFVPFDHNVRADEFTTFQVYLRISHISVGQNEDSVAPFRDQAIKVALGSIGAFESAHNPSLAHRVPAERLISAIPPEAGKPRVVRRRFCLVGLSLGTLRGLIQNLGTDWKAYLSAWPGRKTSLWAGLAKLNKKAWLNSQTFLIGGSPWPYWDRTIFQVRMLFPALRRAR